MSMICRSLRVSSVGVDCRGIQRKLSSAGGGVNDEVRKNTHSECYLWAQERAGCGPGWLAPFVLAHKRHKKIILYFLCLLWLISRMARRNWRNRRLPFAIAVVLAALAFYACWWEPSSLTIVHRTIAISPWHREHSGLRVAVMSDLHVGSPYKGLPSLKRLVSSVNA